MIPWEEWSSCTKAAIFVNPGELNMAPNPFCNWALVFGNEHWSSNITICPHKLVAISAKIKLKHKFNAFSLLHQYERVICLSTQVKPAVFIYQPLLKTTVSLFYFLIHRPQSLHRKACLGKTLISRHQRNRNAIPKSLSISPFGSFPSSLPAPTDCAHHLEQQHTWKLIIRKINIILKVPRVFGSYLL